MIRITTPVPGFTGMSAGVNFTEGAAEVDVPADAHHPIARAVAYFTAQGYGVEQLGEPETESGPEDSAPDDPAPFDPAEHDVDTVLVHLAAADETEQARVLAAEASGKARKTILQKGSEQ